MGHESQGMLLSAEKDGEPVILIPEKEVAPGTKIH
jgi:tRNA-binding EMAP/Myf-like protein